jgi:hypothetical protein
LDGEEQKKTRTEEAIGRASLLVAGSQSAKRELKYLVDALRSVLGQASKFQSQLLPEDVERLRQVQEALNHGANETSRRFDSTDKPDFRYRLRDHACGFLAPLIAEMTIQWPAATPGSSNPATRYTLPATYLRSTWVRSGMPCASEQCPSVESGLARQDA